MALDRAAALLGAPDIGFRLDQVRVNEEVMRHFLALLRIDITDPPGNETKAVEYIRQALEADRIVVIGAAKNPARRWKGRYRDAALKTDLGSSWRPSESPPCSAWPIVSTARRPKILQAWRRGYPPIPGATVLPEG